MPVKVDPVKVDKTLAIKELKVVGKGLTEGLGEPVPGQMCVEAAVAYASGEPHSDNPSCVHRRLCNFKIELNDSGWSNDMVRAEGLRRLAIAQLGSAKKYSHKVFLKHMTNQWLAFQQAQINKLLSQLDFPEPVDFKKLLLKKGTAVAYEAADAYVDRLGPLRDGLMDAPRSSETFNPECSNEAISEWLPDSTEDEQLAMVAEWAVQALKKMRIPGTKFLHLTEKKPSKKHKKRKKRK